MTGSSPRASGITPAVGGPLSLFWQAARELDPGVRDESQLAGATKGHLAELFAAAGLRKIEETVLSADLEHASFEEWWEPFSGGVGPAGAYVASLDADRQVELREHCRAHAPRVAVRGHGPGMGDARPRVAARDWYRISDSNR